MTRRKTHPQFKERSFGISVGSVLLLIAAFLLWRGRITAAEIAGGIGAVLLILGLTKPLLLKWPSAVWWKFAMVLGYVNARVILTIAFADRADADRIDLAAHRPRSAASGASRTSTGGRRIPPAIAIPITSTGCIEV